MSGQTLEIVTIDSEEDDTSGDENVLPPGYNGPTFRPPAPVELRREWVPEENAYWVERRVMRLNKNTMLVAPVIECFYDYREHAPQWDSIGVESGSDFDSKDCDHGEGLRITAVASLNPEASARPELKNEGAADDFEVHKEENLVGSNDLGRFDLDQGSGDRESFEYGSTRPVPEQNSEMCPVAECPKPDSSQSPNQPSESSGKACRSRPRPSSFVADPDLGLVTSTSVLDCHPVSPSVPDVRTDDLVPAPCAPDAPGNIPHSPVTRVRTISGSREAECSAKFCFDRIVHEVFNHSAALLSADEWGKIKFFQNSLGLEEQEVFLHLLRDLRGFTARQFIFAKFPVIQHSHLTNLVSAKFLVSGPSFDWSAVGVNRIIDQFPARLLYVSIRKGVFLLNDVKEQLKLRSNSDPEFCERLMTGVYPAYKINPAVGDVFLRLFLLYSPLRLEHPKPKPVFDQLWKLRNAITLHPRAGGCPKISRATRLFETQDQFHEYFEACKLLEKLRCAVQDEAPESVGVVSNEVQLAMHALRRLLSNRDLVAADLKKPQYLRRYTVGSVLCAALTCCVDFLRAADKPPKWDGRQIAADVLDLLVHQELDDAGKSSRAVSIYLPDFRGYWFMRATELFKQRPVDYADKILLWLGYASDDDEIRFGEKHWILRQSLLAAQHGRTTKTRSAARFEKELQKKQPNFFRLEMQVGMHETVPIESLSSPLNGRTKRLLSGCERYQYRLSVRNLNNEIHRFEKKTVNDLILELFAQRGYKFGLDGGGQLWLSLFVLLFWDILNERLPDAYLSSSQVTPSDFGFDDFYRRRKDAIEARLKEIRENVVGVVQSCADVWEMYSKNRKPCLVTWDCLRSIDHVGSLASAMGGYAVAKICELFAKHSRSVRLGLPDMVVWSPDDEKYIVIQVVEFTKEVDWELKSCQDCWMKYFVDDLGLCAQREVIQIVSSRTPEDERCVKLF